MEKASKGLKLIKEIARPVSPQDYNYNQTIKRLKEDILAGLRVGFFIQGKAVVGFLNKETKKIEIQPLEYDFGDNNE